MLDRAVFPSIQKDACVYGLFPVELVFAGERERSELIKFCTTNKRLLQYKRKV